MSKRPIWCSILLLCLFSPHIISMYYNITQCYTIIKAYTDGWGLSFYKFSVHNCRINPISWFRNIFENVKMNDTYFSRPVNSFLFLIMQYQCNCICSLREFPFLITNSSNIYKKPITMLGEARNEATNITCISNKPGNPPPPPPHTHTHTHTFTHTHTAQIHSLPKVKHCLFSQIHCSVIIILIAVVVVFRFCFHHSILCRAGTNLKDIQSSKRCTSWCLGRLRNYELQYSINLDQLWLYLELCCAFL